jgi:hypothetical protein
MRKLFILFLLAGVTVTAQKRAEGTIELVPHIGYSSYSEIGNYASGLNPKTSVNYGVAGDYYFNNRWSLRTGLLAQTMGATGVGVDDKLNYLNIPINANWHFGSTRKWNLNFGLTTSFLMSASGLDGDGNTVNIKPYVDSSQYGISYGIGYKLEVTDNFSLMMDFQGFSGLNDVAKDAVLNRKNAGSSFNLGGVFKL